MWHSILNFFGVINEGGKGYGFWSGFGSDLGEIAIIGAVYAAFRRHNCHVRRCWRIQRHAVEGTPWVVCRKHHPRINDMPTAEQVAAHSARARQDADAALSSPSMARPDPA